MRNERTVTVKLTRGELIDLTLLCNCAVQTRDAKKWLELHEKLYKQLKAFDEKHFNEN